MWCLQDTRLQKEGRAPLKQLPLGPVTPVPKNNIGTRKPIDDLTSSDEYPRESNNDQSTIEPHSLPASAQQGASQGGGQEKSQSFSRSEKRVSMVGSPNYMYLNAAYSSSVEVLPYLYSKVDLSKKTKNRQSAETTSDSSALVHTRRRSKSSDSILSGSPSGSPTSTHFAAFAASDTESVVFDDSFLSMIPPQKPRSERVSLAQSSVSQSEADEGKGEVFTVLPELPEKKGTYSGGVEALERTLSEVSQISQKGN